MGIIVVVYVALSVTHCHAHHHCVMMRACCSLVRFCCECRVVVVIDMARRLRAKQPQELTGDEVSNVLACHAPSVARKRAINTGIFLLFEPSQKTSRKAVIDRVHMEEFKDVMGALLDLNSNGVFNPSTLQQGIEQFDTEFLGGKMLSEEHEVVKKQSYAGEHSWKQAMVLKRYMQALSRIKNNSTSRTTHPGWVQTLLDKLSGDGDEENPFVSPEPPQRMPRIPKSSPPSKESPAS